VIYIIFVVSLAVLLVGSDWLIESAEKIGLSFGISPFIIGVTIVAFGTSLPELATSLASVASETSEIVIGNVVGSNIANILLVLGLTTIVGKGIKLDFNIMEVDMPLLIISAILFYFAVYDLQLTFIEAIIFILALVFFLYSTVTGNIDEGNERPKVSIKKYILLVVGGVMVYLGATYTIYSLEKIAIELGLAPSLIALTVIAIGTSLPEVIVSMAAARKGKHAIAVGNVLGSNIFNTYGVMAIPSLYGGIDIPSNMLDFSVPFMIVITLLFAFIVLTNKIGQWVGVMLVLLYIFYITHVIHIS